MSEFKIGDRVVVIRVAGLIYPDGMIGRVGTIVGDAEPIEVFPYFGAKLYYRVEIGSQVWRGQGCTLRKIEPPKQDWVKLCALDTVIPRVSA